LASVFLVDNRFMTTLRTAKRDRHETTRKKSGPSDEVPRDVPTAPIQNGNGNKKRRSTMPVAGV
jgi:hypothetical protein